MNRDTFIHVRAATKVREKAVKKAAKTKRTLTQYIEDLIEADNPSPKRSRRNGASAAEAVVSPRASASAKP